jgi:DNA-binding FadR family transcriptional regulator
LRKAAALVRQEQLIEVRAGIGGGYFARRPGIDSVAHVAAVYLQTRRVTLEEIVRAIGPLWCEMGLLAAENRAPEILQRWSDFQERDARAAHGGCYDDFLDHEREFSQMLGVACQNSALELFIATLHEFSGLLSPECQILRDHPDRLREYWSCRRRWVAAILDGDVGSASHAGRHCTHLITTGLVEDREEPQQQQADRVRIAGETKGSSTISRLVNYLREISLATPPDDLMGSEDHLVAACGVSRPTLRQAAALLSQEQLLTVKRGMGGGYFARRPTSDAVAHVAGIYLQSRSTTLGDAMKAVEPVKVEMAMLAARNRRSEKLNDLRDFMHHDNMMMKVGRHDDFIESEREFTRLIGSLCSNSVLLLILKSLYYFSYRIIIESMNPSSADNRFREYWTLRQKCVAGIVEGNSETAAVSARRCARMVTEWLDRRPDT